MSDENENVPGETGESASQESQGATAPSDDWSVTEEEPESTQETIVFVDYTPVIQDVGLTISGAVLFGAFMIAGILIAFKIMGGNPHGR